MSEALTQGIRVVVRARYIEQRALAVGTQYAFAYTIRIFNEGTVGAQIVTRHWIITDGDGKVQEVRGEGVVGQQPVIKPGQSFEYTSGCVLETPLGTMEGTYHVVRDDGVEFDAEIAPFLLAMPEALH